MESAREQFERIRREIDAADDALVLALDQRAQAVTDLSALRQTHPEEYLVLAPDEAVVERVLKTGQVFPKQGLEATFREVLSSCASQLSPVSVAAVGPAGSFGHLAARQRFGRSAEVRLLDDAATVLDEVQRGRTTYGLVVLETTSDGAVTATLHGLVEADVKICGDWTVPVSYHVYVGGGASEPPQRPLEGGAASDSGEPQTSAWNLERGTADIEEVVATPSAIAACERQLRSHFPAARIVDVATEDVAAARALKEPHVAALGTGLLRDTLALRVLRERVEDEPNVQMRFAVVGSEYPSKTGSDRTIVAVAVHDEPGALLHAIQPFAERNLNLSRLELRPSWSAELGVVFFIEIEGHITDRSILTAVEAVRAQTRYLKVLGSFPVRNE